MLSARSAMSAAKRLVGSVVAPACCRAGRGCEATGWLREEGEFSVEYVFCDVYMRPQSSRSQSP